ncbi:MAG: hypothetical protein ACOZQL_10835 [Myxococcota bacterium]
MSERSAVLLAGEIHAELRRAGVQLTAVTRERDDALRLLRAMLSAKTVEQGALAVSDARAFLAEVERLRATQGTITAARCSACQRGEPCAFAQALAEDEVSYG